MAPTVQSIVVAAAKGYPDVLTQEPPMGDIQPRPRLGAPRSKLMLPRRAVETTPEVLGKSMIPKASDDDGESNFPGSNDSDLSPMSPLMGRTRSARSRTGKDVVCPPGLDYVSRGSALHASSDCQPCAWFWRPGSCHNGKDCCHCHLCPEGEIKARKKRKHAMMRLGLSGMTPKPDGAAAAAGTEDGVQFGDFAMPASPTPSLGGEPRKVTFSAETELDHARLGKVGMNTLLPLKVAFGDDNIIRSRSESFVSDASAGRRRARLVAFLEGRDGDDEEEKAAEVAPVTPKAVGATVPAAETPVKVKCPEQDDDAEEADSAQQGPPGLLPSGPSYSVGAELHGSGHCRPCAWYWRPGSCQNEGECGHCHMCGKGELKTRKKQKQAMLRLGLATPKSAGAASAGASPEDAFGFSMAATLSDKKPSMRQLHRSNDGSSTTASSDEHEHEREGAATPEGEGSEEKPKAKTRVGAFVSLPPGLRAPPGTPSHGSVFHKVGNCWPCAYFWKQGGCPFGEDCGYCHLCPQGEMKNRKHSKEAMMRLGLATPKHKSGAGSVGFCMDDEA